jgi:hypothetical protein
MPGETPFGPLSHERPRREATVAPGRVTDEYVFSATADHPTEDGVVRHSVRVDPAEGADGELLLHVTRRRPGSGHAAERQSTGTVRVAAPDVEYPPLGSELESVLEDWYVGRCRPDAPAESSPADDRSGVAPETGSDSGWD